jgi:ABC-type glycerol-3-phosphate transport system substrate-binding protein
VALDERIGADMDNIYKPAAVDPWSYGGTVYGLGNELNAVVFAYRQDVMDAAGIETPFATWDDVIAAGKTIVADGETKMLAVHDLAFGDFFMASQFAGTSFFDAEGNYQADNELGVEALTFLRNLVYEDGIAGLAPADAQEKWAGPPYWAAFRANKFVAVWGPPWHLGNLMNNVADQSGKWAVQKIPTGLGEGRPTANFGGTGQCITEQSQNQDIAWDLLQAGNLTVDGALNDFRARTVYPAYIPAYESEELKQPSEFFGGAQIGQVYASVAGELPPFNQSPLFADAPLAMEGVVITPVMNDRIEPAAALQELGEQVAGMKR